MSDKTTTIRIDKSDRFDKHVTVGVNGQIKRLPVGSDIAVTEGVLSALAGSDLTYTVISPKGGKGASESGVGADAPATVVIGHDPLLDPTSVENRDANVVPADKADVALNEETTDQIVVATVTQTPTGTTVTDASGGRVSATTQPAAKKPAAKK